MRCVIGLLSVVIILNLSVAAGLQAHSRRDAIEPARLAKLRDIQRGADQALERIGDYRVRLHRREVVNGRRTDDRLMMTIRNKPFSVHIKCLPGGENAGREMIYVAGSSPDETMNVLTGKGDILAGMRMDLAIRSERVASQSRRTIAEAGFTHIVHRFNVALEKYLTGQPKASEFEPLGLQPRPESRAPMDVILQHIVAGEEALLPHGGKRYWHFSQDADLPESHLPTLIITFDDRGQEVEYYCHDRLLPRVAVDNRDFDADRIWGRH